MSDESTPSPSLRLKPRIRPDTVSAPPPTVPKVAATLEADGILASSSGSIAIRPATVDGEPKLKRFSVPAAGVTAGSTLKRLPISIAPVATPTTEEEPAAAASPVVEVEEPESDSVSETETETDLHEETDADAPAEDAVDDQSEHITPPSVDIPTRFSVPPPSEDSVDVGRFKLKPRLSAPDNSPPPGISLPSTVQGGGHATPPPGVKIVATAPVSLPSAGSIPKVGLQPRAPQAGRQLRRVVIKNEKPRFLKFALITLGVLVGIGIAVGGFMGFRYLSQMEKHTSAPVEVVHTPAKKLKQPKPAGAETESENDGPPSSPGKAVGKAATVASAPSDAVEATASEDAVAPAASPTAVPPTAGVLSADKAHGKSVPALETNAQLPHSAQPKKILPPTAEFRSLIVNLRVNGVFQGDHPRALLNGRLMNAGEILDQTLQVRFTGLDPVHKQLLFEDGTGALMQRHY